jgi:curved DNA-binding protein CbpA
MKQDLGDYYAILGVSRTAHPDEIKLAFHRKAREYHPDVSNRADADEMFSVLNKAYSVLRDKKSARPTTLSF